MTQTPHKNTVVVSTLDLEEFKSLCESMGVDYHIYAHPSNILDKGNCLVELSDDDMNLMVMTKPDKMLHTALGMKQYLGDHMMLINRRMQIEVAKCHSGLEQIYRPIKLKD